MSALALLPAIAARRSRRAFDPAPLPPETIAALLEAARWAPSSNNEQPWRPIVVAATDPSHAGVIAALTGNNPRWAPAAPILVVMAAVTMRRRDGRPNRYAWHDTGMAAAQLLIQAEAMGLATHVMAGWDVARLREAVALPPDVEPVTVIAVGWPAAPETLPEDLRDRESAPRARLPLAEIVSRGRFGVPFD